MIINNQEHKDQHQYYSTDDFITFDTTIQLNLSEKEKKASGLLISSSKNDYQNQYNHSTNYYTTYYHQQPQFNILESNKIVDVHDIPNLFMDTIGQQTNLTTNKRKTIKKEMEDEAIKLDQKTHYISVNERKRKIKRESHNLVEKKRRNNINENIKILGELLPENIIEGKTNKGTILKGSVQYVKQLKNQIHQFKSRIEYLENEITLVTKNM